MNKFFISVIFSFLFFGCSLIPKIEKNEMIEIKNQRDTGVTTLKFNDDRWWEHYNDVNLTSLINLTLEGNSDLKIAKYNIEKSIEAITLAGAQGGLSVDLTGGVARQRLPKIISETFPMVRDYVPKLLNTGELNLQASYNLDLFNKIGALEDEAKYRAEAVALSKKYTQLNISTQIAKLYQYWTYLQIEKANLMTQYAIVQELLKIQTQNYNSGNGIKQNVLNSESQVKALENLLKQNQVNQETTINAFKALAGNKNIDKITAILKNVANNQNINIIIPNEVNSDIIINRPDVQYYLMLIKAQEKQLESAKAGFYPQFSITGKYGFNAVGLNKVLHKNTLAGLIGASVYLPIFHMDAIRSTYRVAGIDLNIIIEKYNQDVVNALVDVNNKLYKTKSLEEMIAKQDEIMKNQRSSFNNIATSYRIGNISKNDYLLANLEWLNNELDNKKQHYALASQKIDFINSVGGIYIGGNK